MTDTRQAPVHALLADGRTVRIRRAGPGDHAELLRLYEEMSPANGPHGVSARDARIRLLPRHAHDPYLRRLR